MFYGGLNGDGFFDEEYCGGGYEDGEGVGGYRAPEHISKYDLTHTGKETPKAVQYKVTKGEMTSFVWLAKKGLCPPHWDYIEEWYCLYAMKNIVKSLKQKYRGGPE